MSNILDCLAAAPALMPMPGEAVTQDDNPFVPPPSTQSPSPRSNEGRQASRRRSLEVVAEAQGDVDSFVRELDQKRRQLDDQIHKFIAQKEREFKLYERELRTRYRTPSTPSTPPLHTSASGNEPPSPLAVDKPGDTAVAKDDANHGNIPVHERESELLGLFTPAYLPLLDGRPPAPGRSPSAPPLIDTNASATIGPDRQSLQRANTDPVGDPSVKSLSRLALGPRTPSSGSDPGKNLVSALKSPSAGPRLSKQKRVSLIVGDEVVAPSDNVFSDMGKDSERQPEDHSDHVVKANVHSVQPEKHGQPLPKSSSSSSSFSSSSSSSDATEPAGLQSAANTKQPGGLSLGFATAAREPSSLKESLRTPSDPQGDIELSSPFSMDEEFGSTSPSQTFTTQIEDIDADVDSGLDSESTLRAASPASPDDKHMSPVSRSPGLEVPISRIRSSSSASAQPISPGFSRPSVREDPQLAFADQAPVETPAQGSFYDSFTRPSYSKQQTSGSLGESFMQRNAEEMMRRRQSTPRS